MRVFSSQVLLRKYHRWLGGVLAIPGLFLFVSGLILQLRNHIPWLQPTLPDQPPVISTPVFVVDETKLLETINLSLPKAPILHTDINQIDIRPHKNLIRVRTKKYFEYQLSINPLKLLNHGPKYSTLVLSLHSGEYFGSAIKYFLFLPVSFLLLGLWISGVWLLLSFRRTAAL